MSAYADTVGTEDGAIGPEMFQKQEKRYRSEYSLCEATGRGHFMQYEDPEWFADRVIVKMMDVPAGDADARSDS